MKLEKMLIKLVKFNAIFMSICIVNSFIFPVLLIPFLFMSVVSFIIVTFINKFKINKQIALVYLFVLVSIFFPAVSGGAIYDLKLSVFLVSSLIFAHTLVLTPSINVKHLCWLPLYISISIFFLYVYQGRLAEDFLPLNSRNFVAVTLFMGVFSYFSLSKDFRVTNQSILIAVIIFFFSVYSIGRAGILLSFILLSTFIYLYFMDITKNKFNGIARFFIRSFILWAVLFLIMILLYQLNQIGAFDRFSSRGLHDLSRKNIIKEYLETISLYSLIFGVKLSELTLMMKFNNNLHNSYLTLHSSFGLFYFLGFTLLTIFALFISIQRKYYPLTLLVLIFLVRGLSDVQILGGRGDWVVYFLILFVIQHSPFVPSDFMNKKLK